MAYTLSFGSITGKLYLYSSTVQMEKGIYNIFFQSLLKATYCQFPQLPSGHFSRL